MSTTDHEIAEGRAGGGADASERAASAIGAFKSLLVEADTEMARGNDCRCAVLIEEIYGIFDRFEKRKS